MPAKRKMVPKKKMKVCGVDSWDVEYSGSAIELVHNLCSIAYGGEILASKAVQEAYNRDRGKNQRTADKVFIQQLGSHDFENLRTVDLVPFTPQELQARNFPSVVYIFYIFYFYLFFLSLRIFFLVFLHRRILFEYLIYNIIQLLCVFYSF